MATYDTLELDRPRPGVVRVTLNRPDRLNALTFVMFDELRALCAELAADDGVRVVVLTGAGRGFCSGLDLEEAAQLSEMSAQQMLRGQESWASAVVGFRTLPKPVIAAVNGPAAGAGFSLALAADLRVASPAARFNAAFVRIGLSGGDVGMSWLLPRIVGLGHAYEILLTGAMVDAQEAYRMGLVNRLASAEDLQEVALEMAEQICANSPFGIRLTKQVVQTNIDAPSLEAAVELENRNQVLCTRTADMVEALAAFRDKRLPRFEDR